MLRGRPIASGVCSGRTVSIRLSRTPSGISVSRSDQIPCQLSTAELEDNTPYDTRRQAGLPPTPIASPGQASIEAALAPAEGPWTFYVLDVTKDDGSSFFTDSVEESKAIRHANRPFMIVASSGMLTGGRIMHHLKDFLPDPASTLLFIGYQGEGTLGRHIQNGATSARIDVSAANTATPTGTAGPSCQPEEASSSPGAVQGMSACKLS